MYRSLFGVPDVITDMTRSLEIVETKIDILDDYIRTPEVFRVISEKTGVPEGYQNPPGELMGHMGLGGKREGRPGRAARPLSLWSELD